MQTPARTEASVHARYHAHTQVDAWEKYLTKIRKDIETLIKAGFDVCHPRVLALRTKHTRASTYLGKWRAELRKASK